MFLNAVASALLTAQSEGQFPCIFRCAESSAQASEPYVLPDRLFAAFGGASTAPLGSLSVAYLLASIGVYLSLIYQIRTRTPTASGAQAPPPAFPLPAPVP